MIATALPVQTADEVQSAVQRITAELRDAGHHAYGYRLGWDRKTFRYSDDGEPSGTAGKPILQQIDRLELTQALVVVSRIFGGTKLGTGGLVRAYGGAAAAVLEHAEVVEQQITARVAVDHDYGDAGSVQAVLHGCEFAIVDKSYGARTVLTLAVPIEQVEGFAAQIGNATAGRAQVTIEWPEEPQ